MDILIEELDGALWALAIDQDHKIVSLEIDTPLEKVRWGDIFQARVKTIDKARDAAFVDLGDGLTGILYNKNIRLLADDGTTIKGGDKSIGQYLRAGQTIVVQAKTSYIETDDDRYTMENKIAEVSMDISIQGRYLIHCPYIQKNRLSSRIVDKVLYGQMRDMLDDLEDLRGFILRAAACNIQTDILRREANVLKTGWQQILNIADSDEPQMISSGLDAVQRILSDLAMGTVKKIEVVTMEHYHYAEQWSSIFAPDITPKIQPVELPDAEADLALLAERDVLSGVEALQKSKCPLPSGGNLIIQPTAALTAIDINKSGDVRSHLNVNIEAVTESLRQIRLRNIGGLIMLDTLNMKSKKEKDALLKAARLVSAQDPCTTQIHGLTNTGLLEVTRKRRTATLAERLPEGIFS